MDHTRTREHARRCAHFSKPYILFLFFVFIGFWLPGFCRRFAVNGTSRVRHHPLPGFPVFHNEVLTVGSSIAIWNKNRVVVAIALGVWAINIGFLIQGESARPSPLQTENLIQRCLGQVLPG